MSHSVTIAMIALFAATIPVRAQDRGTVEFGAFGSVGTFDQALTLKSGYGGGGRVGVFLTPRVALEFEMGEMRATRTLGLRDVNVGILAARAVATAFRMDRLSLRVGAGAGGSTETNFLHSYALSALAGVKLDLNERAAFRVDATSAWLANNDWKSYQTVQVGMSLYRQPARRVDVVHVAAPMQAMGARADSVSAEEQARRRGIERDYARLRDSLARAGSGAVGSPTSSAALAIIEQTIHFARDRSDLTVESRAILDAKIPVFRANPAMRIIIEGHTDATASDDYNVALGARRSASARAYLVERGVPSVQIEVTTMGERNPVAPGNSASADARNRRAEFRLLVASAHLVAPES